jgi:phosphate transport system permease protein
MIYPPDALRRSIALIDETHRGPDAAPALFHEGPVERRKRAVDRAVAAGLLLLTTTVVLPVALILGFLVVRAWPALSWTLITDNPRQYMTAGGLWAPLVGTFVVVLTSLLFAAPLGILAGIYLHEYAADNWRTRLVNLAVLNLAGVPSIVHALFGVGVFVMAAGFGRSVLAASCTLAIMTLPVIIASTREALAAVPYAFREACWILGASRWQTIRRIVLPNAVSGILTGVILQVSRAAGETAPILFTGAVFYIRTPDHGLSAYLPYGWRDPFMALSYHLFTLATQVRGAPDPLIYATAVLLIALVFAVNAIAIVTRARLRLRRRW